jgi:cytidine deaminase
MAIVADGDAAPTPCGACRQVLAEFCDPDFTIYTARAEALDAAGTFRLGDLLPHAFALDHH